MRKVPTQGARDDEGRHVTGLEVQKLLAAIKGARHEAREMSCSG